MTMFNKKIGYVSPDYIYKYHTLINTEVILKTRQERETKLFELPNQKYYEAVQTIADIQTDFFDFSSAVIKVGRPEELSPDQKKRFHHSLQTFCPWKKGPFELFGITIDAEWRSDWKWERILPHISSCLLYTSDAADDL